jgi:hypothetical protein
MHDGLMMSQTLGAELVDLPAGRFFDGVSDREACRSSDL